MQTHELQKPKHIKTARRVGRGGKRGTFSGRGMKGQKSRAGARIRPNIWDYIAKIPKLRGQDRKPKASKFGRGVKDATPVTVINLDLLNRVATEGVKIDAKFLVDAGAVRKHKGRLPKVKILSEGVLGKKITVSGLMVSGPAREKIEQAGGSITE
ncbi:MAG: uL15m family ribosomal protein [Candidatus Spechtbacterales bacterium]